MKYIDQKVAYIRGLADGLELDTTTNEGKVLEQIIEVLGDVGDALEGLAEAHEEMKEYIDVMDEDLSELEDIIIDNELYAEGEDFEDGDDDDFYEVICPSCKSVYIADFEAFESDSVICPDCGAPFHLEEKVITELTHGEGCKCGHHHE